jgi:hypothetical protein
MPTGSVIMIIRYRGAHIGSSRAVTPGPLAPEGDAPALGGGQRMLRSLIVRRSAPADCLPAVAEDAAADPCAKEAVPHAIRRSGRDTTDPAHIDEVPCSAQRLTMRASLPPAVPNVTVA